MSKAYINAISEGPKSECLEWLIKIDAENDDLKAQREELMAVLRKIDRTSMDNAAIIEARALLARLENGSDGAHSAAAYEKYWR